MKHWIFSVITMIALQGCATMSVDECASADWRSLGFQDGSKGETLAKAGKRGEVCARHDYAMDRPTYENGRFAGLGLYCNSKTGYSLGELGKTYNGVCTDHNEGVFLDAYNRGLELYSFTAAVTTTKSHLNSVNDRHAELDRRLNKYWGGYRVEGLTTDEHNIMVLHLWAERKYLRVVAIPYWNYAHQYLGEQLSDYQSKISAGLVGTDSFKPRQFPGPASYTGPSTLDAKDMLREAFSALAN